MARDVNKDLKWIREHEEEFIEKYLNKYLLIRKCLIEGVFDDRALALLEATRRFKRAKFVIYHVVNDKFIKNINERNKAFLEDNEDT
jgi:hypothetical protein